MTVQEFENLKPGDVVACFNKDTTISDHCTIVQKWGHWFEAVAVKHVEKPMDWVVIAKADGSANSDGV